MSIWLTASSGSAASEASKCLSLSRIFQAAFAKLSLAAHSARAAVEIFPVGRPMLSAASNIALFVLMLLLACAPAAAQQGKGSSPFPIAPVALPAASADSLFPLYPIIEPNVRFWEKIYDVYSCNQGVLHDKDELDVVYAVISRVPKDTPGAAKINEKLDELARLRYKGILMALAKQGMPRTQEEARVFSLFKTKSSERFRAASENIRLQIGLKEQFRAGVVRSGAYLPVIRRILRDHGLPLELAYLPHVESAFNPQAHSKSAAVGLWQFTKHTGRDFMNINELVDERFDLYAATDAAARFLKENYRQLGSWPLALTAYNHGRGGMLRAKKQWGDYPSIFASHQGSLFGFASRNFYSEFLAAIRVAGRLEHDPSLIKEPPWLSAAVKLRGPTSVKRLLQYFAVGEQEFVRLNPALLPPVLEGRKNVPKGYFFHLPATPFVRERMRTMPDSLFCLEPPKEKRQARPAAAGKDEKYVVRKGDTASSIARKFGVALKALLRTNHLKASTALKPGQQLAIPASGSKGKAHGKKARRKK